MIRILWTLALLLPLVLAGAWALGRVEPVEPPPEVSLGVMKSCTHMGELAKRVARDRTQGVKLDKSRYREYQHYIANTQPLFDSPGFGILLAYRYRDLEPVAVKNLGVQVCVAAYYGFKEAEHHNALHHVARSCQDDADNESELNACMGDEYQEMLSGWWSESQA